MEAGLKDFREEIANLGQLEEGAGAIVAYCLSLGNYHLSKEGNRFVVRPDNFITFEPHWKRTKNVTITIRGNPNEFEAIDSLTLKESMNGYSTFSLSNPNEFAAAFSYARRASEIFKRGRTRTPTKPVTIEK